MFKRILCFLLIVVLVCGFSGCGIIRSALENFLDNGPQNIEETTKSTEETKYYHTGTHAPSSGVLDSEPIETEITEETEMSEKAEWSSETHALVMVDVEAEVGRMMDFVVTFYGKMGDVYVITEEPTEIPAGDYTVVVESESYVPHREEVTVVPGEQIVTDFTDIEFVPQEEYVPFSSGTVVTVGSKAYYCEADGIYCINAETKVDELGKDYVNPETSKVYDGEFEQFAFLATNGILAYVADTEGVVFEIDLISGVARELTEALGEDTYVCGADINGVFVSPYINYDLEENWTVYGKVIRISLNTGEVELDRLNVSCETANGYTYLRGISGGVDPNSLCIYDYMGDPVLELDMVWNVTAMGDKLCISQAIEYDRSFRILTYGDGGLEPIYEVELLDGQTLLYAMVCGGMLNYSYYDQDSFDMTNSIVDLYTFDDITGVYPELGETLSIIYQTGDFKYYCTMSNVYFAGPGYVFAVRAPYGEGEYYSHFFVNGCVIEVDTYNGIINTLTPPVA